MIRTNHLHFHIHTFYTPTVLSLSFYIYLYFIFIIFCSHHYSTLLKSNFVNSVLIYLIERVTINTIFSFHSSKESNNLTIVYRCLLLTCIITSERILGLTRNPHTHPMENFEAETVLRSRF
jgi:hypothetical protein